MTMLRTTAVRGMAKICCPLYERPDLCEILVRGFGEQLARLRRQFVEGLEQLFAISRLEAFLFSSEIEPFMAKRGDQVVRHFRHVRG
jgi:hypothetical protein